jgi:hypothetical protein
MRTRRLESIVARSAALLGVLVAASGCRTFAGNIEAASRTPCHDTLEKHAGITADPRYPEQSYRVRHDYEEHVAACFLSSGEPGKALALAGTWEEDPVERLYTTARAHAALGDDGAAREALEGLAKARLSDSSLFVTAREFDRYLGQDWFVELGLRAWSRHPTRSLESFAARLVGVRPDALLTLSVASADERPGKGRWALWTGVVRDARIEHGSQKTVLFAEGVDVVDEVTTQERIVKTETRSAGTKAVTTPVYRTEHHHQEKFEPNGREFVIEARGAKPALVELRTVIAFGRYSGRDGAEGRPVLDALVVMDRRPKESKRD